MKTIVKLNGFQRECETAEDLRQLKKKLLDLNNGATITLKLNGRQRIERPEMASNFAENLVEGLK